MAEAVLDQRAANVIDDIVSVLSLVEYGGVKVFRSVESYDDPESFIRVADPLSTPNATAIAAVIASGVQQGSGSTSDELHVNRVSLSVLIQFFWKRELGGGEGGAVRLMQNYTSIVRNAIMADRSRKGNADRIIWSGAILDGTDVTGEARFIARDANAGIFVVSIPVACGWQTLR